VAEDHSVRPFVVDVADTELDDLRRRLASTRWSPEIGNDDWSYGTSGRYLRQFVEYWLDGYDWRAHEAEINSYAHFRTVIDGLPIHFLHERGRGPSPMPLILSHGWPWTFWDWHQVIGPLTDPAAHGLDPAVSFDVVVPSLPGFAFSTPLPRTGVTPWVIADLWNTLMRERLGYRRYGAVGGDWGSFISTELGSRHQQAVTGVYLSLPPVNKTGGLRARSAEDYAPDEAGWYERSRRKWQTTAMSHVSVQTADPQSLAWALDDSPAGLASWLLERRRNWCDGDLERVFSRDFLITTVCLYWFTRSIGSSMRIYADTWPSGLRLPADGAGGVGSTARPARVAVPTGLGIFPGELCLLPRSVVEQVADVVFWSVHDAGGHFGPAEQPAAYVNDLRRFFGALA
jgi:pimeloyl-ACP methyl ester carboxylesterase